MTLKEIMEVEEDAKSLAAFQPMAPLVRAVVREAVPSVSVIEEDRNGQYAIQAGGVEDLFQSNKL